MTATVITTKPSDLTVSPPPHIGHNAFSTTRRPESLDQTLTDPVLEDVRPELSDLTSWMAVWWAGMSLAVSLMSRVLGSPRFTTLWQQCRQALLLLLWLEDYFRCRRPRAPLLHVWPEDEVAFR